MKNFKKTTGLFWISHIGADCCLQAMRSRRSRKPMKASAAATAAECAKAEPALLKPVNFSDGSSRA